ncbi:MAG: hypothetical protein MUO31_06660 [Thermodesulfovibrionales bacterium]|nr:hypothetical protein [Thermodesulfovibrionales bacterium]
MTDKWTKCYDDSWKDHIVPEAFSHPAKMAYGLLKRILDHVKGNGWLVDVIVDPFGGIGSTGILGAYDGFQVICVELEQKFVDLAKQNFALHANAFEQFGCPYPVIIQGDSRRLSEIIGRTDLIVSSPPYAELGANTKGHGIKGAKGSIGHGCKADNAEYGQTPGQLGSMKAGKVDLVISSPPFQGSLTDKPSDSVRKMHGANMGRSALGDGYGHTPGNLGNLKAGDVSLIVSSPPYEEGIGHGGKPTAIDKEKALHIANSKRYSDGDENLGNQRGDCFWKAAREILEQCYQILRPGGHAIWVCKDFVRKGQRVPFSDDWLKLCEAVGFKLTCRHKAMLVKEETKDDLFGGTITKKTERKSFFRRLAEAKGSPAIDHEDVICVIKN